MPSPPLETRFVLNLYATPADWQRDLFYSIARAGHIQAAFDHRVERETYPGHEWILCLKGKGWVRVAGKKHELKAGQLLWVNCHHPHAYGAVSEQPWELYWMRIEGRPLDRIAELLKIRSQPVFTSIHVKSISEAFENVFQWMTGSRPSDAALASAAVAAVIGQLFDARLSEPGQMEPELPLAVQRAVERMRLYFHVPMRVVELAQLSGMSESHFSRQFKAAMGTSPIDWLRRERIHQAKRRLVESADPVKEIARQVGYHDQFFFSKDFKKMTKLTPSQFREQEGEG